MRKIAELEISLAKKIEALKARKNVQANQKQ